jgi:hypothetical protein
MKQLILVLAIAGGLTSCTTEQANNWAAAAATSFKAGWDAGGEIAEARREAWAARTPSMIITPGQPTTFIYPGQPTTMITPGQSTSFIYFCTANELARKSRHR